MLTRAGTWFGLPRDGSKDDRRQRMIYRIYRRIASVTMTAGVLLFSGTAFSPAAAPGFAGAASATPLGVQGRFPRPLRGDHQALLPPSIRGSARRAARELRPNQSFTPRRGVGAGTSSQTKPEDTLQIPPAGAPAAEAISLPGPRAASYAASYCATPRGACKLAQRQIVGDKCWCVTRAGQYANGTVEHASIGYAGY
jgi:hypothetical protein